MFLRHLIAQLSHKQVFDDTTMIIVTNTANYSEVTPVAQGKVSEGVALLELE